MDNFHSTVLGRPASRGDEDDGDKRRRDILNPPQHQQQAQPTTLGPSSSPPRNTFTLRSPTQPEFHRSSINVAGASQHHGPASRNILNPIEPEHSAPPQLSAAPPPASSTMSSMAQGSSSSASHPLPPPLSHSSIASAAGVGASASTFSPKLHAPRSPLHGPSSTGYYPQEIRETPREKAATGSFYDPTTDTTTTTGANNTSAASATAASSIHERRPSDSGSWHNTTQASTTPKHHRDPYHLGGQPAPESSPSYYNGTYKSPAASTFDARSPHLHSASRLATGSTSPPPRAVQMASPSSRHSALPGAHTPNGSSASSRPAYARPESPLPSKEPASTSTPSRAADVMSMSNILSSTEPIDPPRREVQEQEPEDMDTQIKVEKEDTDRPKKSSENKVVLNKGSRKSKGRSSSIRETESTPKEKSRRASSIKSSAEPRVPAKRQVNGQAKKRGPSAEHERSIREYMDRLDEEADGVDDPLFEDEYRTWRENAAKRRKLNIAQERTERRWRREQFFGDVEQKLHVSIDSGKRRYDDQFYEEALGQVREQEVHAEKERKKDMQRKRRREKSMATTEEQRQAALARADAADNAQDRDKFLREAERFSKKTQQTKMVLQKGLKGPSRSHGQVELNLEGGTMNTFQAADMEPGKAKGKGKGGTRLKKSKEQKQLEKDNAEAAQAALDAGEDLPSKEDTQRIRIKLSKKSKDDSPADKENKEPKATKEKEAPPPEPKDSLETRFLSKGYNQIYDQIWRDLARKDVSRTYRLAVESYAVKASNLKKTAILASKEAKRWQLRTNKGTKDQQARAKRVMRDMMGFWKRNEREERDLRKAAERQELENARKEEADREAARQKRKLNFLISQTEIYSHFISKKVKTDEVERSTDHPDTAPEAKEKNPHALDIEEPTGPMGKVTDFKNLDFDAEDDASLQAAAVANAQNAIAEAQAAAREFDKGDDEGMDEDGEMNFQNPTGLGEVHVEQPKMLTAQLKEYQLKGLNWLANLYEQGINGILADEMGLGKTVQSISVMAYLAEKHNTWGPFLVVAPASTLHNWQQELKKFVPDFKVLPYWGSAGDRKVLRKFWDRKHSSYKQDAQFHVLVTSYQLVVADVAFMSKMKWQYMILDEAQAIKSSQSSRWKVLLNYHCRNRLLLTGTPIQNNMQELWALLHFIMPTLFDSHDEFSEWFSKDIESHAQSNTKLNEDQLKRLHMILKPFMLRRVKKHVQKELGDKIEHDVFCNLTYRQRAYYANLRNQISIMDLIEKATLGDENDSKTLMNLVMQFRKVCNHPDLFERAETTSPCSMSYFAETASFSREGNNVAVGYSVRSTIDYELPQRVWQEGGRLNQAGPDNQKAGFRNKYLNHMMNIWTPDNIRESLGGKDSFSWLRFADASPAEVKEIAHQDVFARAVGLSKKKDRLAEMAVIYDDEPETKGFTPGHALLQIRDRAKRQPLADITGEGVLNNLMNVARVAYRDTGLTHLEQAGRPNVSAPPIEVTCIGSGTAKEREETLFNVPMRRALYGPNPAEERALVLQKVPPQNYPTRALLPAPDVEKKRFTNITVPSMQRFVTDSGKLAKLDELLFKLKEGGHRVLLYFQMTRMIDLMEEYLTFRNYKYCRLDGSTKLEDRRDTVADFQTRPEIFIFLLSTRAGGLGINLTSADTVIFYDSDWNPTIDSQAMDRAHRLGQTRQVTVYRLITRGTIEERIRKRALQKEEVQRVVISGGGGGSGVDFSGRRAPDNRNRDIAMWLADDDQAEMIERRERELLESGEYEKQTKKKGGKKRKTVGADADGASLDDMYHEGEGNFDDKPSGTATPVEDGRASKKKKAGGKKAKTAKQRLAMADGDMD